MILSLTEGLHRCWWRMLRMGLTCWWPILNRRTRKVRKRHSHNGSVTNILQLLASKSKQQNIVTNMWPGNCFFDEFITKFSECLLILVMSKMVVECRTTITKDNQLVLNRNQLLVESEISKTQYTWSLYSSPKKVFKICSMITSSFPNGKMNDESLVKMTKTEKPNDFGTHPTIYMPIDIYMYFQIKFLLILLLRKTILKVSRQGKITRFQGFSEILMRLNYSFVSSRTSLRTFPLDVLRISNLTDFSQLSMRVSHSILGR